jgi:phage terminase small subunit
MSGSMPFTRGGTFTESYDAIWDANRRTRALLQARRTYSAGADSSSPLNVPQRAHAIGDPVPIVFARRRNDAGGILISPRATECRFENSLSNEVTAFYHLVLSEGRIGDIEVRDVFQRQCRVGSFQQTYNRRAGSWVPENAIVPRVGLTKPEASNFCGSPGTYEGISTMSFQVAIPNGLDVWNRQVHAFIRNGIEVYRWADEEADAPSDSFADLAYWLMVNSARIPAALIDTASIQLTGRFLDANGITTNCWITQAVNYGEFVTAWGRYHLLQPVTNKGKVGLRPLLPINEDYTIKTSAVSIDYVFDDDSVIPGSVDLQFADWASRQPFVCQMVWRQQNEADIGVVRTSEVRYEGTAPDGPYESHDLSEFCTRELHAIRVGAYILAKRVRSSHSIRFSAKPGLHSSTLQQGSIIRVRLLRAAQGTAESFHDQLYEVDRIRRTIAGDILYEASHLPVDNQRRSLIALDVMSVAASGVVFPSGLTGEGCDLNSDEDTTVPNDDVEDTIIPGVGSPAIDGGGGIEIGQGDFPIDLPTDLELSEDSEFDIFVDELTIEELIAIIDDLLDDLADELRELTDEQLEELADDELTAEEIRELDDAELIELLEDAIKDVIKEDLDLGLDPELVEELIERVKAAKFDIFVDELTIEELIAIIDDLLDDLADELRELTDEQLEELADDELTAEEIRELDDAELIELLEDAIKDVIKEDLDLGLDPELVEELIERVKAAKELEDATGQTDLLGEHVAGAYFHNATWDDNVLTVRMRLAPTGRAPREDLGNLSATIGSTSVVALLPDGSLADPQPESLPSVSFSGLIAEPWDAVAEGTPIPPADRVFEGQFVLTFYQGDFPPVAENPAEQLTYRATVEFSSWNGGFTEVSFLNTLDVDFVPTDAPPAPEASVFYWDGLSLLSTKSEDITRAVGFPSIETSLLGQPAMSGGTATGSIDGGLVQASQDTDFTLEWFAFDVISGGFELEIRSKDFFEDENYPNYQYFILLVTYDEVVVKAASGPPYEDEETVLQPVNTNGLAHLCIQRINGIYYAHVSGQLMASSNYIVSNWEILFRFGTQFIADPSPVIAGQGRFSNSALYGADNFIPPAEAFYVPDP